MPGNHQETTMTIKVIAIPGIAPVGAFQGPNSGNVAENSDGTFSIDPRDTVYAFGAGYVPARTENRFYYTPAAPATASNGLLFNSAALSNGTLAVAANVDVMRAVQVLVLPGTTAITAGNLALTYDANDGTASQVDNLSLITALSTTLTLNASKGVLRMRSQIVTGLTGGTSPTILIGTTAAIAVPVPPGAQDATIISEFLDAAVVTVANAGTLTTAPLGVYTPHTAPNATHNFGVEYTTVAQ
jgi:hypothetical protein